MAIRLLSIDVDGTITNSKNQITDRTVRALHRAAEAGLMLALNTGRDVSESRMVTRLFPEVRYLLGTSGAFILDMQTGQRLRQHQIPIALAREVYQILSEYDIISHVFFDDTVYNQHSQMAEFSRFYPESLRSLMAGHAYVDDLSALLAARTAGVDKFYTVFTDPVEQQAATARIAKLPLSVSHSAMLDLEVMAQHTDKGTALVELAEILGLSMAEIVAVGDSINDISMLRCAGLGVAMGNAVEQVQKSADLVAPDNEHDGLAWLIDRILEGEL